MNNPINDIPYTSPWPPQPEMKAADAFEHWLQGRINTCVDGHASRITRLEDRIQTQDAQIKELSAKLEGVTNPPSSNPEQFDASMERWVEYGNADVILRAMKNSTEWEDAIGSVYGTTEFDDAVKEAVVQMNLEIRVP